jgi:hypothetical protein
MTDDEHLDAMINRAIDAECTATRYRWALEVIRARSTDELARKIADTVFAQVARDFGGKT